MSRQATPQAKPDETMSIATNKKALHDYHILETLEAGLVLTGTEIKSIRAGRVNLRDAFARPANNALWLYGVHIAEWPGAARNNHEPTRPRKLLVHRGELLALRSKMEQKGLTMVPLELYIKRHRAKVRLALAKGKKQYDKREDLKRRDVEREMREAMKRRRSQ